jgi:hypothetical protein
MATSNPVSTLAAALAPQSGSNILKPRDAGHPGTNHSLPSNHHGGLPTPPNSLSPTIPPQKGSPSAVANTPLNLIESDVELHDTSDSAPAQLGSPALDATGDITPALLAKHHLPDILLTNGPLAIRYVLAHLTSTVPGFARIPAAKARRIVVAALESRSGGGLNGDVVFEKVGWGRWDARYRSQPRRETRNGSTDSESASALSPTSHGSVEIRSRSSRHRRRRRRVSPLSPTGDAYHVSEHEADKMSLDGHDDTNRRRPIPIIQAPEDSDMTDEEDWESIGPDGLLARSYAISWASRRNSHSSSLGPRPLLSTSYTARPSPSPLSTPSGIHKVRKASTAVTTSLPGLNAATARTMSYSGGILPFQRVYSSSLSSSISMQGVREFSSVESPKVGSPQEAEAIEALLRMGGM